jgi:hypothetical protein
MSPSVKFQGFRTLITEVYRSALAAMSECESRSGPRHWFEIWTLATSALNRRNLHGDMG